MSIIPSKKIPADIFLDEIHVTEYGIPAEFRKHSVSTEYRIPQYGIPYSAEFRKNTDFRIPRNSVFTVTGGHVIWLTEQRQLTVKEVGIL